MTKKITTPHFPISPEERIIMGRLYQTLRKMALSIWREDKRRPDPAIPSESQREISFQKQSNFFANLSIEIRLLIYRELFGNRSIHVAYEYCESTKKWEFWSIECYGHGFIGIGDCCREHWGNLRKMSPRPYSYEISGRLYRWTKIEASVLLSCRQAYSEGIDLLYSTNEFRFDDTRTLRHFSSLVLPQHLARITTLVFNWPLPYLDQPHSSLRSRKQYDAIWEILASRYPGLRKLRASLMPPGRSVIGNSTVEQFKQAWLEPLDRLASLKLETFEVFVPETFYSYIKDTPSEAPYHVIETVHLDFPVGVGDEPGW